MPCSCKNKKGGNGGYTTTVPVFTVIPEYNRSVPKKTVTSSNGTFVVDRNGVRTSVAEITTRIMFETEVAQLLEQGAPIHVYD